MGTKSVLWGVHQFILHPFFVLLAWRYWHGQWPADRAEWVAIFCHDIAYWGCKDMDGADGREHPLRGALFAWYLLRHDRAARQKAMTLILGHSKYYAANHNRALSDLYAPDKLSVLFEPEWFYLLRARLSGEVWEYMSNAPDWISNPKHWLQWYKQKVRRQFL